jgi:hypothetical protein
MSLDLNSNTLVDYLLFLLNTDNNIGTKGASKLFDALLSNTSLTSLSLNSNRTVRSLHVAHTIQVIISTSNTWLSNYLKYSSQIRL